MANFLLLAPRYMTFGDEHLATFLATQGLQLADQLGHRDVAVAVVQASGLQVTRRADGLLCARVAQPERRTSR